MSKQTLAVKYRPHDWDSVVEQESTKIILQQQLASGEIKNAYLFVGGAGTGKTTCARIFADAINKHEGKPIELDAASNSSVDDVRHIIQLAKTKSLDSEYKVFIIDECHAISNTGWQAFLKLIEEPPAKSIFIFCTTNPEKIPNTILSRVQRYDFRRISQKGIVDRLKHILKEEQNAYRYNSGMDSDIEYDKDALEYIAKLAEGGMRDAITLMDKCLSYSTDLTVENVVKALGVSDYETMIDLTDSIINNEAKGVISVIERVHANGIDLKQFIKQYINFVLDVNKYFIFNDFTYLQIPHIDVMETHLKNLVADKQQDRLNDLLSTLIELQSDIKYDSSPKYMIEAALFKEAAR